MRQNVKIGKANNLYARYGKVVVKRIGLLSRKMTLLKDEYYSPPKHLRNGLYTFIAMVEIAEGMELKPFSEVLQQKQKDCGLPENRLN